MKCKAKWCCALSETNKMLSCIENNGNGKQVSLCNSYTNNDNDMTNIPEKSLPTGPDLPSQSPPTDQDGVFMLAMLSDSSMSRFHKDVAGLVHSFNMETQVQTLNSVSLEQYLKEISLNFSHFDSSSDNIFSGDKANGDTFKELLLTVNSLKSLLCIHNSRWLDDAIFTFSQLFSTSQKCIIFWVRARVQDNVLRANPCFRKNIFNCLIKNLYKSKMKITMVHMMK